MAKNTVPVNFKDDIMNSSMGGKRRYKMINNSDGTVSLEDAKNIFNSAQCRKIISDRIMRELKARLDGLEFRI